MRTRLEIVGDPGSMSDVFHYSSNLGDVLDGRRQPRFVRAAARAGGAMSAVDGRPSGLFGSY